LIGAAMLMADTTVRSSDIIKKIGCWDATAPFNHPEFGAPCGHSFNQYPAPRCAVPKLPSTQS
jgi:hypothetical protein